MSHPVPLTFRVGLQTYAINDPLPAWRAVDGVPVCNTCDPVRASGLGHSATKRDGDVRVH
jgi:hypothetical protein